MDQQRTKILLYKYEFSDFAVFCAEVINVFCKVMDKDEVSFYNHCMEYNASLRIKGKEFFITLDVANHILTLTKDGIFGKKVIWVDNSTDLYNMYDSLKEMYCLMRRKMLHIL